MSWIIQPSYQPLSLLMTNSGEISVKDSGFDAQREFRERGVPSGLANEIYLDVYERWVSFEPQVRNLQQRLFDAYAAEVKRVSGTTKASSPLRKVTSTPQRMASPTTRVSSFRQPSSIASPLRGRSTTDYWRRALPRAKAHESDPVSEWRSIPQWMPQLSVIPTIAEYTISRRRQRTPPLFDHQLRRFR